MLALAAGVLLFINPLLIMDAFGRRRVREAYFFVVTMGIAAVAFYTSLAEICGAQGHASYMDLAYTLSLPAFGMFAGWALLVPEGKKRK